MEKIRKTIGGIKIMSVTLATIQSHRYINGDINKAIEIYKAGGVEFSQSEDGEYTVTVPYIGNHINTGETRKVKLRLTRDKRDIEYNHCYCTRRYKNHPLCRHSIAAIFAVQGGVVETPLAIGKTATATVTVDLGNTANTIGSGSLPVYATPAMIALMEKAACNCLEDGLDKGETSVGTKINAEHIAASPIGTTITAEAKIEKIFGRRIEFTVTAYANNGNETAKKIGTGTHTRAVIDEEKFMERLK